MKVREYRGLFFLLALVLLFGVSLRVFLTKPAMSRQKTGQEAGISLGEDESRKKHGGPHGACTISGRVLYSMSEPIRDATVYIAEASAKGLFKARRVADEGLFSFEDLARGAYEIWAKSPTLGDSERRRLAVVGSHNIDICFNVTGKIIGKIITENSLYGRTVILTLYRLNGSSREIYRRNVPIGKNCEFEIENVGVGTFLLRGVTIDGTEISKTVSIEAGGGIARIDLELEEAIALSQVTMSGRMSLEGSEAPLAGAEVLFEINFPCGLNSRGTVRTDGSGEFRHRTYSLPKETILTYMSPAIGWSRVRMAIDGESEHRDLELEIVFLRTTNEESGLEIVTDRGLPVKFAGVEWYSGPMSVRGTPHMTGGVTDSGGVLSLSWIPKGEHVLRINAPNFLGFSGKRRSNFVTLRIEEGEEGVRSVPSTIAVDFGKTATVRAFDSEGKVVDEFLLMMRASSESDGKRDFLRVGQRRPTSPFWPEHSDLAIRPAERTREVFLTGLPDGGTVEFIGMAREPKRSGSIEIDMDTRDESEPISLQLSVVSSIRILVVDAAGESVESAYGRSAVALSRHRGWEFEFLTGIPGERGWFLLDSQKCIPQPWAIISPRGALIVDANEKIDDGSRVRLREDEDIVFGRVVVVDSQEDSEGVLRALAGGLHLKLRCDGYSPFLSITDSEGKFEFFCGGKVPTQLELGDHVLKADIRKGVYSVIEVEKRLCFQSIVE